MQIRTRRAMTLVELLTVVGVLTVLMALLLRAVSYVRESARRTSCMNRQRQIGLGLMAAENSAGHFVGHYNLVGGKPTSWVVPSFAQLEQQAVLDAWIQGDCLAHRIELLVCPDDREDEHDLAPLSYAVNAGILDSDVLGSLDVAANGMFHNHADPRRAVYVSLADVSGADGATQTILLSENVQASGWAGMRTIVATDSQGRKVVDDIGFYRRPVFCEAQTTVVWADPDWARSEKQFRGWHINGRHWDDNAFVSVSPDQSRPSSNHTGGVLATMADGHVTFLRDAMDYWVYVALMTPDGQHAHVLNTTGGEPLRPLTALIPGTNTGYTDYVLKGNEAGL
jgi:type II secretory pathway pseudopilin PulG